MKKYKVKNKYVIVGITLVRLYFPTRDIESSHFERYLSLMHMEDAKFLDSALDRYTKAPQNK